MSRKALILLVCVAALAVLSAALLLMGQPPALSRAAESGDADEVRDLLAEGADPDQQAHGVFSDRYDGWTPLMRAVSAGHEEAVRALLDAGADPSHRNRFDETPLALIFNVEDRAVARRIADLLIAAGADPAERVVGDETPLHIAARLDWTEMLDRLLQEGVEVDSFDSVGQTPLREAVIQGASVETVRLLLDHGADPTLAPAGDLSPALMANDPGAYDIRSDVAALLIERSPATDPDAASE